MRARATPAGGMSIYAGSETYVGPQGGVNSVLFTAVHHIYDREAARRLGGLDLAHVKGHSGDVLNDRADASLHLSLGRKNPSSWRLARHLTSALGRLHICTR
eukprot:COSAG06_NODE_7807_length_2365_cov_5.041005_3_plen_102_part_00